MAHKVGTFLQAASRSFLPWLRSPMAMLFCSLAECTYLWVDKCLKRPCAETRGLAAVTQGCDELYVAVPPTLQSLVALGDHLWLSVVTIEDAHSCHAGVLLSPWAGHLRYPTPHKHTLCTSQCSCTLNVQLSASSPTMLSFLSHAAHGCLDANSSSL